MNQENYIALIFKKLKGSISLEEQSILDVWIGQSVENEKTYKEIETDWQLTKDYESEIAIAIDVDKDFQLLQQRIRIDEAIIQSPQDNLRVANQPIGKIVQMNTKKASRNWIGWASAAVIALALGFWFSNNQNDSTSALVALQTKYQEKKEVQLVDGTKIWLNEDSKLSYPTAFDGTNRIVQLTGEAYFDVAKNPNQPFIIETNQAKITVLGTAFNVRTRITETVTEVVVAEGRVRFENNLGDKSVELIKNQKGVYSSAENTLLKTEEQHLNDMAWHSNKIIFSDTPLAEVVEVLEELYDVTIQVQQSSMLDCTWSGFYKVEDGVQRILEKLKEDLSMRLEVKGNTTYELHGGACKKK